MIDLKLIPNGEDFEFFCRDLLEGIEISILQNPSRGPDGKKDLIIQVETKNSFGKREIDKYLVQCKHKAKSNRSIYERELGDIRSACKNNKVDGYFLITSTTPSVSVQNILIAIQEEGIYKTHFWDKMLIEKYLKKCKNSLEILESYDLLKTHEIINFHAINKQESSILQKIFNELQREIEITNNFEEFINRTNEQDAIIYSFEGIIYGICVKNMKMRDSLQFISKLSNLECVIINNTDLTEIPELFYNLVNIDWLTLSDNEIKTITSSFNKLEKVRIFDIQYNPIEKFTAPSHSFKYLERFCCDSSQLKSIKSWISLIAQKEDFDFEIIDVNLPLRYIMNNQKEFGIENIGEAIIDLVVNAGIKSFDSIENVSTTDLTKIEEIGSINAQKFKNGLTKLKQKRIDFFKKVIKKL